MFGEVGDGQGDNDAEHPARMGVFCAEQFNLDVEMLPRDLRRLRIHHDAHHRLSLFLVKTCIAQLARKFQGIESNRAHGQVHSFATAWQA